MNKIERMKAVFANETPDYTPAGFWFHFPKELTAEEACDAQLKLYRELDNDIIKVMDDNFGNMFVKDLVIEKPSDWRNITLPGRECYQYQKMEKIIRLLMEKVGSEVMVFPTVWSPFKMAAFATKSDALFMQHCKEDPESVMIGVQKLAEVLVDWTKGYLDLGVHGIYYACQFSEPTRFDAETWAKLVKPYDLMVLNTAKEAGAYNIVHICGEPDHGYRTCPQYYVDYPGDMYNWDVHRSGLSLEEGRKLFNAPILGGLDNHGLLDVASIEEIVSETKKVIAEFGRKGFMLGADCTVPKTIDVARLKAAVDAAKN